jgi:hypothetical protein
VHAMPYYKDSAGSGCYTQIEHTLTADRERKSKVQIMGEKSTSRCDYAARDVRETHFYSLSILHPSMFI